ncbi:hypothetical protein NPIL_642651, partial [Nephila pilipes]
TQWTNRPIEGRVSVDRSKVAALALTTPRPVGESSTDDSAPPHHTSFELRRLRSKSTGETQSGRPQKLLRLPKRLLRLISPDEEIEPNSAKRRQAAHAISATG